MEPKKRRRKKGFGYYLYAFVSLTLLIAILVLSVLLLFHVQEIQVTGNSYVEENQILSLVWEDPNTSNALYTLWKFKSGSYHKPEYVEAIDVSLKAPWKVQLQVTEKKLIGCMAAEGEYSYFDKEGMVLLKSEELLEEIPVIEGLGGNAVELYEKIPMENEKVFSYILQLTEELEKQELAPDRILWEEESMTAYFENVCVQFGKSGFEEKVLQVSAILPKLEGKKGVLHLEHYSQTGESISFEEKEEKKK